MSSELAAHWKSELEPTPRRHMFDNMTRSRADIVSACCNGPHKRKNRRSNVSMNPKIETREWQYGAAYQRFPRLSL